MSYSKKKDSNFNLKINHYYVKNFLKLIFNIQFYLFLLSCQNIYYGHNQLEEMYHDYTIIESLSNYICGLKFLIIICKINI